MSTTALAPPAAAPRRARGGWWRRHQRRLAPYLFVAPFFVLFCAFFVGPLLFAAWLSLHDWSGFGALQWAGTDNYRRMLHDPELGHAIGNTLFYVLAVVVVLVPVALLLAVGLDHPRLRARHAFRTAFLVPTAISAVVAAVFFVMVFDTNYGLLNGVIKGLFGGNGVDWLGEPWTAKLSVAGVVFWRWAGLVALLFLAGLQDISREQVDAARVDGAKGRQVFWHVTLPGLRPVTVFVVAICVIGTIQIFEEPFILTSGGPAGATRSVVQLIYNDGFIQGQFGYAATIAVLLVVATFTGTIVAMAAGRLRGRARAARARAAVASAKAAR
ncbi:MAG TPA: sugar ABC transporter permease [Conexibacter sp.]|nr:sugar ABC transporter permease [Conexibacter sp.]